MKKTLFLSFLFFSVVTGFAQHRMIAGPVSKVLTSPASQATTITFSNVTDNSMSVSWAPGNGRRRVVIGKSGSAVSSSPINNTTYTASTVFGSGTQIGSGNYTVYNGTGSSVDITGLSNSTTYYFQVMEYDGDDGKEKYNITSASGNPASQTTLTAIIAPTTQATNVTLSGDRALSWTRGNGSFVIVVAHQGGAVDSNPVDGQTYTASSTYGSGSQIGSGNYVIYVGTGTGFSVSGLAYNTLFGIRAYEFNGANGSQKYNTNTATGNPLSVTTVAEEVWYLYHHPIAESARYGAHIKDVSRITSKSYSGSFAETSTEYLLFLIGDNLQGPTIDYNYDQTYLRYKSKSDGLPFQEGWQWYADGTGEPIAVLPTGFTHSNGSTTVQTWLATPTVIADNNIVAYHSYNHPNIGSRYAVCKVTSTDGGRTWTHQVTNLTNSAGGEDHYQFQQALYDSDVNKWYILSPNARDGSQGRWTSVRMYESTDGSTGLTFTKTANDILNGTEIDVEGFGLFGPMWKQSGRYYWFATEGPVGEYKTTPATDTSKQSYSYLQKKISLVSTDNLTQSPRIENIYYTSDQEAIVGLWPASKIISHGGANHILVSCFVWKPEDYTQLSIDVRVLSSTAYSGHSAQTVGRNVYPGYMHRFFKLNRSHVDDSYQSTTTNKIELITNNTMSTGGSGTDPAQFAMNCVTVSGKYPQASSFTHSTTALGVKMVASTTTVFDHVDRGIIEKAGTFKIVLQDGNKFQVEVTGANGGKKIYRATANVSTHRNSFWQPLTTTRVGFTCIRNLANTDFDLKLNIDYALDITVTKIQDDVLDAIAQTSNPITFGHAAGATDHNQFIGSCIIMSGTECTQQNWLEENCL